jgi:hypothetical protein
VTAPQPWRDPPPAAPSKRPAQDPHLLDRDKSQRETETEMSWGKGLVPAHLNGKPHNEGGIYMATPPAVDITGREVPRPRGEVRAYPGERIAR